MVLYLVVRVNVRKCIRLFFGCGVVIDIENNEGVRVEDLIKEINIICFFVWIGL